MTQTVQAPWTTATTATTAATEATEATATAESVVAECGEVAGLLGGGRAAGELGLTRVEFARAVQLGLVRAGPQGSPERLGTPGPSSTGSGRPRGSRRR